MTRAEQMRQYKADGHTSKEVAQKYEVSERYARRICKGIAPQGQDPINEDVVSLRIKEKSNGLLEYLSGYTNRSARAVCTAGRTFSLHTDDATRLKAIMN